MMKKLSLILQLLLYAGAGVNHFVNPEFYEKIIPPYMGNAGSLNVAAGVCEIIAAILLLTPRTRNYGVYLVLALLTVFIPIHIYTIQIAPCVFCGKWWAVVLRLFPVQVLLMLWIYSVRINSKFKTQDPRR